MMASSTLVETVSINYEDFTEGFLTCSTCLYTYDEGEHAPKLLTCSHTVCKICLERITSLSNVRESGSFRCPICRETIALPRGGVSALPPSFLVNQLLDLVQRQRREVIPKCSSHVTQELLFCEACDCVFCSICTGGTHGDYVLPENHQGSSSGGARSPLAANQTIISNNREGEGKQGNGSEEHTVIPFSIAIKRMSEILLYKAQQCITKLNEAADNVQGEMRKLDVNSDSTLEEIDHTFQEIITMVERRREDLLAYAKKMKEEKRAVLDDQQAFINQEKSKIEAECNGLEYHVEVSNISRKISDLTEKLDSFNTLLEPRENCFIRFEHLHNSAVVDIQRAVANFGTIRSSRTLPSLCRATVSKCSAHIRSLAHIYAYDYNGQRQKLGGDLVSADLKCVENGQILPVRIIDNHDGTYEAEFIPTRPGKYQIKVFFFNRPIRDFPIELDVSEHINPLCIYGCRGSDQHQFIQPVDLAVNTQENLIYVLDTGNCRIKVLAQNDCTNSPFTFIKHITREELDNRACTGLALYDKKPSGQTNLLVSNWRTRQITEMTDDGEFVRHFGSREFVEPTKLAVNSQSEILVGDNGAGILFVLHPAGKVKLRIPSTRAAELARVRDEQNKSMPCQASKDTSLTSVGGSTPDLVKGLEPVASTSLATACAASSGNSTGDGSLPSKPSKPTFGMIGAIAVGPKDEILVADSVIHVFSAEGDHLRTLSAPNQSDTVSLGHGRRGHSQGGGGGVYCGLAYDEKGFLLATRTEKQKSFIQVFDYASGTLKFTVDSNDAKLRRPTSLATTSDYHVILVDLGNDCIKKYRYH